MLRLLVVVLLGVVLARPQTARPDEDFEVEGIDIVITLDLSGSMAETDLLPNRLVRRQAGHPGLRAPAAAPTASAWWCSPATPTPTCR